MKILIVDDHPMVLAGIRAGVSREYPEADIIEAATAEEGITAVAGGNVDVAVLDLRLAGQSGLGVARYVSENSLKTKCIVLTSVGTPSARIAAYETGAVIAFLEKRYDVSGLLEAIRAAEAGTSLFTQADAMAAAAELAAGGGIDRSAITARELEVADAVADGLSDLEISEKLFLAISTVRNNLSAIYKKLHVESRTQLAYLIWESRKDGDALS